MAELEPRTLYTGTFIHCTTLGSIQVLADHTIGVDEHGKIAFITHEASLAEALADVSWKTSECQRFPESGTSFSSTTFFFPGFLDTHIHASQHPNAGIFGKTTLLSWLETYTFPLESSLSNARKAEAVYTTCVQTTLSHGTTTAAYYATISVESTDILARICRDLGQRAFVGRCAMDNHAFQPDYYRDADAKSAIAESRRSAESILAADINGKGLVKPIITPRFALSCSEESLTGLAAVAADLNIPIQTHVSENIDEIALVAEHFPNHASYTALYHACHILGPRTILAHACHLTPAEISLVKSTNTALSHCPVSNTSLGSGLCPVRELLDQGITIGLGTDVSGGYSPSILVAAREAGAVSRLRTMPGITRGEERSTANGDGEPDGHRNTGRNLKLTVEETLYLATRGGAAALGLGARVGGFEVGMQWDALFVDLGEEVTVDGILASAPPGNGVAAGASASASAAGTAGRRTRRQNVQIWHGMSWEERLAKWVHLGDERNIAAVWVDGRMVVQNP